MPDIKDFPIIYETDVRWGDMDAFNHVNNVVYFRYFECARIKYFEALGFDTNESVGPILAETKCRFHKPLAYPDTIKIGARTTKIGTTSMIMEYIVFSNKIGIAATGEGVVVSFDYKKNSKVPIPKSVRIAIEKLEKQTF